MKIFKEEVGMKEEKLQILKMIEEGKITADEGVELLNALEEKEELINVKDAKWIRVRVNGKDGKQKVNVNIPISLIDIGLKIGTKYHEDLEEQLGGINLEEIIKSVKEGAEGKLVEVEDENGDRVEVFVE